MENSFFSNLSVQFDLKKASDLEVKTGKINLSVGEIIPWLSSHDALKAKMKAIDDVKGMVSLSALNLQGPLSSPESWNFQTTGKVKNLSIASSLLPDILKIPGGNINITSKDVSVTDVQLNFPDSALKASGTLTGYLKGVEKLEVKFNGNVGQKNTKWLVNQLNLPPILILKPPVSISEAHLTWNNRRETTLSGQITLQQNLQFYGDVFIKPDELRIKKLIVQDKDSHATIKFTAAKKTFDLSFSGNLTKSTLDRFISKNEILQGWVEGDFYAHLLPDQPEASTVKGQLRIQNAVIPWKPTLPVEIHTLSLNADGTNLRIESANLSLDDKQFDLKGNVNLSPKGFLLDMEISADEVNLNHLKQSLSTNNKESHNRKNKRERTYPVQGVLKLKTKKFTYGAFTWNPFSADISFSDSAATVTITKATFCGIDTPGILRISPQEVDADFKLTALDQDLNASIFCLWDKSAEIEGNYKLDGSITAKGRGDALIQSLSGTFNFATTEGRFYGGRAHGTLIKIFRLLNISEMFKGKLPDINQEGFGFNSIRADSDIQNGKLTLHELVIDGTDMGIAGYGSIDLTNKKVDAVALVAPLKTVDYFVKKIPLVRNILGNTFISIPFKIKGPMEKLEVTPLSPSAVGEGLVRIMKRTLHLPVDIIQPILPSDKKSPDQP